MTGCRPSAASPGLGLRPYWRQLRLAERLIPTSRRAAAGVRPSANSFKNCWRFADIGRRQDPYAPAETAPHKPPQTQLVLHRLLETTPVGKVNFRPPLIHSGGIRATRTDCASARQNSR